MNIKIFGRNYGIVCEYILYVMCNIYGLLLQFLQLLNGEKKIFRWMNK